MATTKLLNLSMLQYYDGKLKAYVATQIDTKIGAVGNIFTLKGTKASIDEINALTDMKTGDIWLVPNGTASDEYFYTGAKWELMGTTATDISGCVTTKDLYAGAEGTGTTAAPAEGTILANLLAKIADGVTDVAFSTAEATASEAEETVNVVTKTAKTTVTITSGDGSTDDTQSFENTWKEYGEATEAKAGLMTAANVTALAKATTDIGALTTRVEELATAEPNLIVEADIDGLFA